MTTPTHADALAARNLTDEELRALQDSRVPERFDYLNADMEDDKDE